MGTLRLIEKGFETQNILEENRNRVLQNFIRFKNHIGDQDKIVAVKTFFEHVFSYGNFYSDFVFASWDNVKQKKSLKGIQQMTMRLLADSYFQQPVFQQLENEGEYHRMSSPHANMGMELPAVMHDYVYDVKSWSKWHFDWLTQNPHLINWDVEGNDVFPYPSRIREILLHEIEKKGQKNIWQNNKYSILTETGGWRLKQDQIVNAFYESIMKHLSPTDRIAYVEYLGSLICEMNHYIVNAEASFAEEKYAKSKRKIYSIIKGEVAQYVSFDFRHGMFEFLDSYGHHVGEKRFDGSFNSESDASHDFKVMNLWDNKD